MGFIYFLFSLIHIESPSSFIVCVCVCELMVVQCVGGREGETKPMDHCGFILAYQKC